MSSHNLYAQLRDTFLPIEFAFLKLQSATGVGFLFAGGAAKPADTTAGYAKGCLFFLNTGTSEDTIWYINDGDDTSCVFVVCVNT